MSNLIKCSDCKKKVSVNAHSCPKCGAILSEQTDFQNKKNQLNQKKEEELKNIENNKKFLFLLMMLIVSFFAFLIIKKSIFFGLIMFVGIILVINPVKKFLTKKYPVSRRVINWISFIFISVGFLFPIMSAETEKSDRDIEESLIIDNDSSSKDSNLTQTQNVDENSQHEFVAEDYSHVAYEITQKGFPQTYNRWGKKWIDDINKMMPLAVQLVSRNPKCDVPSTADLSDNRSIVRQEAVFYVDCENTERFYISQNELKSITQIEAESEVLSGEPSEYIKPCQELVKAQLNYPHDFITNTGTNAFKGTSGNIVVEIPFIAKNALGTELTQFARCVFGTDGRNEAIITNR